MWALLQPLIAPLAGALLSAILAGVTAWMRSQSDQNTGATIEASKVSTTTVKVVQAEAQAEANAPTTLADVIARLNAGTA